MAETDRWPTKGLEVFDSESAVTGAARSEYELNAAGRSVAVVDENLTAAAPLTAQGGGTATKVPTYGIPPVLEAAAIRSAWNVVAREYARLRRDWRRLGTRWAVPALVVIVVIQSAWLIRDYFRDDINASPDSATSIVGAVPDHSTQATSGVRPADPLQRAGRPVTGQGSGVKAVAAPGTVSIAVPFQVEIYENGRFVGINGQNGVPLTPGSHRLELVNESLRYRSSHTVAITSGRTTQMAVELPTGTLHVNAAPWAEVLIDGDSVGETPLANIQVPIGSHQVTFRHPQFGEQTRAIVVVAESSTRMAVDLQK